jgi:WD40 repeat protein
MVGKYGETLVVDWGLAKPVGRKEIQSEEASLRPTSALSSLGQTQPGSAVGTPAYMSPEQAEGKLDELGPQSDVYSLGATLYHVLTGKPPFEKGDLAEILGKVQKGDFPHPQAVVPGVPRSLEAICLKAMSLKAGQRYPTARALEDDLELWLADEPVVALPDSLGDRLTRFARRHKGTVRASAAALILLAAVSTVAAVLVNEERKEKSHLAGEKSTLAEKMTTLAQEKDKLAQSEHDANVLHLAQLHRASMADHASAMKAWQEDYDAERKGQLAASIGYACKWHEAVALWVRALELDPSNAHAASRLYDTLLNRGHAKFNFPRTTLHNEESVLSASFSPDGTRVVTRSSDKTARIWDATTGRPLGEPLRHVTGIKESRSQLPAIIEDVEDAFRWIREIQTALKAAPRAISDISPDRTRVVTVISDNTAQIWDAVKGEPLGEPLRHDREIKRVSFSPDGTRVVTAGGQTARIWDAATGEPLSEPLRHDYNFRSVSFSPDGTRVVTSGGQAARIWDVATSEPLSEPLRHNDVVWIAVFSPDSTRVITASRDHTARIWDAATGAPVGDWLRHENEVNSVSLSPDGTRVVTFSKYDHTARVWDMATGKRLGAPLGHDREIKSANFSPDGTRIVTASDLTVWIWDAATYKPRGDPLRHKSAVNSASFSPDGTRVVTASGDDTARIWDAKTGNPIGEVLRHGDSVDAASFSPDGTHVVTASRDHTARIWDAATGKPLGEPLRHDEAFRPRNIDVACAKFSPNGTRVVTASLHRTACIWDAATSKPLGERLRHDDDVYSARFSSDGTRVVTASADDTARIWDAATGKPWSDPLRHDSVVWSASFSPDDTRVITAGWDGAGRIWEVRSAEERKEIVKISREILDWAQAISGLRFTEDGELRTIPWDETSVDRKVAALPPGPWADLAAWLRTSGPQQTLSPKSKRTLREVAERERDFGSRESLQSALQYDPTVPLARMMLANVLEKEELAQEDSEEKETPDAAVLARAAHWRRYDLDRLPNDPTLRKRAAEILLELPNSQVGVGPHPITAAQAAEQLSK